MKVSLLFPFLKGMQGAEFLEQAKLPVGERALEFEKDRDEREPGERRATKVGCSGCGCSDLTLMKGDDGSGVSSKLIPSSHLQEESREILSQRLPRENK